MMMRSWCVLAFGLLSLAVAGGCSDEVNRAPAGAPSAQAADMGTTSMPGPQAGTPGQMPIMMPMNRCGDGQLTGQEQCDDGNQIDTDGCRNNCQRRIRLQPECETDVP